jgi:plastocyanin
VRLSSVILMAAAASLWHAVAAQTSTGSVSGSVSGRVTYIGKLPEPIYVFESGSTHSIIALDAHKGVAAAVIYLHAPAATAAADSNEVIVNQRNWWFTPGVVAVRAGRPVRFTNEDSSNHNVRATHGAPANRFSAYTGTGQPYVHRFRTNPNLAPTVVTCDIHAWMMAWVYLFDHPHFTTTATTGDFRLPEVPAGRYRLSVRHGPSGLSRDIEVDVPAARAAHLDVVFDTADLRLPDR